MTGSTTSRAWRNGRADWKMHLLSIFSLAVAFVCLASALLVVSNLDRVRQRWTRLGRATVYLREGADSGQIGELRDALARTGGVRTVRLVTPEEARRELVSDAGDSALAAPELSADPRTQEVAAGMFTLAELLTKLVADGRWTLPDLTGTEIIVQPHCHHSSVLGFSADLELLTATGATVTRLG